MKNKFQQIALCISLFAFYKYAHIYVYFTIIETTTCTSMLLRLLCIWLHNHDYFVKNIGTKIDKM